ncbi:MAG: sulfite exporter TauE/SafE family protein [Oscillibacter sp.]
MTFEIGFLFIGLISIFGHFVEGSAGFGCTVIAAPIVNSILPPAVGVPFGTLMAVPFLVIQTLRSLHSIAWKDLGKILLVCLPGVFVGQYLFTMISPEIAKICIGSAVTVIALMKIFQNIVKPVVLKKPVDTENDTVGNKILRYTCLIVGGVVQGAFNIGGPLITVYTIEAVKDKVQYRNTMLCFFMITDILNAVSHFRQGLWTPYLGSALLVALPLAAVGFFAGVKFLDKINRETFLRFVYVILLFVGANMLIRALMAVL